jgi:hypothetical protein
MFAFSLGIWVLRHSSFVLDWDEGRRLHILVLIAAWVEHEPAAGDRRERVAE